MAKLVGISEEEAIDLNYPRSTLRFHAPWMDFHMVDRRRRSRMRRRAQRQRLENMRWWDQMFAKRLGREVLYADAGERKVIYAPPRGARSQISGVRPGLILIDDPLVPRDACR